MEIKEILTTELKSFKSEVDAIVQKANAEAKENANGIKVETMAELKNVTTLFNEKFANQEKLDGERQKQMDDIAATLKDVQRFSVAKEKGRKKSFYELTLNAFGKNFDLVKGYKNNGRNVNIEVSKAASVMTPQDNWTGEVAPPDRNNEIIYDPRTDAVPASALIRNFTATSNLVKYIQETDLQNYTATVLPGATKPRSSTELTTQSKEIVKIATEMTFAEEMLEDFAQYGQYITVTLQDLLNEARNEQILYGSGIGQNLDGLTTFASAFVPGAFGVNVTRFDILMQAVTQVRKKRYNPTAIVLNPQDYLDVVSDKNSDGSYHFGAFIFGQNQPSVMGVPIIMHNTMQEGDFLVVTANGASLWDRLAINVRFYDQHGENAVKNLITAVCETRLALTPERPNAFVYGDFASALAASSGT
jgi:hypothetical protein